MPMKNSRAQLCQRSNGRAFGAAGHVKKIGLMGLIWCVAITGVQAQTNIVPLHPDGVETNEPCIAIDPKYPGTQILGSNTSFFFVSDDAGQTWKLKPLKPKEGFYGDPVVYINRQGYFYVCHLSKNETKPWPDQFDRIVFEKSIDQGQTFTSVGIGHNGAKVQDKPWFCVDESKHSKFRDRIYVAWTEFDKYGSKNPSDSSRIRFAYSANSGDSFSQAITVSDSMGDAEDGDNTLEGATLATGRFGELFLVWAGKGKIWFDMSLDGGKTWGKDRVIAEQKGSWNTEDVAGLLRSNSMPFVAADNKGNLYVVFGDNRNGDQDVFYLYSKDKGLTWTPPIRIHNDAVGNHRDQFMPTIAVDRSKNRVYVAWYDRRNSLYNGYTDVYASCLKGSKPGKNIRLTNEGFCVPSAKVFFGDYMSIAAARNTVRVAYTTYDAEKLFATVEIALTSGKTLKKAKTVQKFSSLQIVQMKDTPAIYIHFYLPGYKSCTLEMHRGDQLFFKQLFDPLTEAENEVMLPLSRFPTGVYKVMLTFKGKKLERDFYIERR